jgi:predicted TIM-barrel fold metal-dependent hydrolase
LVNMSERIWTHSADSHIIEPETLWSEILPRRQAERMPRTEPFGDHEERVTVDGRSFVRPLPKLKRAKSNDGKTIGQLAQRPPGAYDYERRLDDLTLEGVWAEVLYPSLGLWCALIEDRALIREAARAENEWLVSAIQSVAPDRYVCAALMPMVDVDDAVAELEHAAEIGLKIVSLPTGSAPGAPDWHDNAWEPLWSAAERASMVIGFHIGTDGEDPAASYRGPGGAILNYVETTFGGQRSAMKLVASGALDRHPDLRVLVSEGGATWAPFIGDRMNEAYRQHGMFVRPALSRPPKEILYRQVYASFQHDESAPAALWAMGYRNVLFGSDYPHIEGTYGHTQKTLHELFDDVGPEVRARITTGAFEELFPHVSRPPA